jgi:hypothetical protein
MDDLKENTVVGGMTLMTEFLKRGPVTGVVEQLAAWV